MHVDSTPLLNFVFVKRSLIFAADKDPLGERLFDGHYIFVNGGLMEVGRDDYPYTSRMKITMHG